MEEPAISATALLQSALAFVQSEQAMCDHKHTQISDGAGPNFGWVHQDDCHRCFLEAKIEAHLREQDQ